MYSHVWTGQNIDYTKLNSHQIHIFLERGGIIFAC